MSLSCACPEHYPDWDGKDIDLGGHCVHALSIPMLLHMPISYEVYLKRQYHDIQALQLSESWPNLVLTRTGMFRGTIMRPLEKTFPSARQVTPRGRRHHPRLGTANSDDAAGQQQTAQGIVYVLSDLPPVSRRERRQQDPITAPLDGE